MARVAHNKNSLEMVKSLFIKNGYTPLFDKYNSNDEKLPALTKEGYKIVISYSKLNMGRNPMVFGYRNPYVIENIKHYLKINNISYILLSDKYISACKDKLLWKCDKGHVFKLSWNSFQQGRRCPECFGKFQKSHEEFLHEVYNLVKEEYTLLSNYIKDDTHIKIKHNKCNHEYNVTPSHFLQGKRCPKCAIRYGENNNMYNPTLTDEDRIKRRIKYGYSVEKWRKEVFQRDDYTCKCCGNKSSKGKAVTLNAHHLDGYNWCESRRFDVTNGVTLCKECHFSFHRIYGNGNNTEKQFIEFKLKHLK
ncbi:HNH endonuclease [Paraclostridium sp. AKS81]|uniref:HNH endonuclease n=1 Tax=Paraclostridium sp. AKS81 TaxID=2876117 RepID=UPI0021DFD3F8|nr:HNH endonuclease [Paraclostridium sp. AKS81]MCU9811191.1 HNH endonuclease [Paraclostridium sp. AKS81]